MSEIVMSRILIHGHDQEAMAALSTFCEENNLIGLQDNSTDIMQLLDQNINLGALLLNEEPHATGLGGIELGLQIHKKRPELPIFLQRTSCSNLEDLSPQARTSFAGAYQSHDLSVLKAHINEFVFNQDFPHALVRGVQDLTIEAIQSQLKDMEVLCEVPYIANELIRYGDLSSHIPIEGAWCKGYMMIQLFIDDLHTLISADKTHFPPNPEPDIRNINAWLSETTNQAWGLFKARFLSLDIADEHARPLDISIPIIDNVRDGTISTGASIPQICFSYLLQDKTGQCPDVHLVQKLIFHLHWLPEAIADIEVPVQDLLDSEEVVFF